MKEKLSRQVKLEVTNSMKMEPKDFFPVEFGKNSFYISRGRKYLPFLGRKDNLPSLLLEARLGSVSQNACISSIAGSTIGGGLRFLDNDNPDADLVEWMKSVNNHRKSFDKVMLNAVDGERTQGNQFIEIVRGEFAGKKFIKVYCHSMVYCRLSEPDEDGFSKSVMISQEFAKSGYVSANKMVEIPLWSPDAMDDTIVWKLDDNGNQRTMLHFKNEVAGVDHYGLPASFAGFKNQLLENRYSQANLDNLENNMVLGGMLIFSSAMTKEEAQEQAREIVMSHVGEGKTGRIAVVSSEQGAKDVQFIPYTTAREGSYIETDKRNEQKIIFANSWDAMLAGLSRDSSFGTGSDYIRAIWDLKETALLNPLRKKLIEEVVTPIMQIYADWHGKPQIKKEKFAFHSEMPFSFMADIDPDNFMKVGEARKLAKLDPDPTNDNKYLSEMNAKQKNVPAQPSTT